MVGRKEEWEKRSERRNLVNEKRLEEITSMNKRPKTKKKSLELLKKSKDILCSLTGDWMMTRCKEEEYLHEEMKKLIMGEGREKKRIGKGGEDDCEKENYIHFPNYVIFWSKSVMSV